MSRVIVYIDGFNLYFGLRAARMKRFYWLDLVALSRSILKPGQTLEHVHYFTARIRSTGGNAASVRRQSTYLDALATFSPFTMHEGHFLVKTAKCHACGTTRTTYEEKMSDVNLAVQLVLDAEDGNFDTAIIVSGDSDLTTPVRRVLGRFPHKRVIIAFPPKRNSEALKKAATAHFRLGNRKIRSSLLPDPVTTPAGITLACPAAWK